MEKLKQKLAGTNFFQSRFKLYQLWNRLRISEIQKKNPNLNSIDLRQIQIVEEFPSFRKQRKFCQDILLKELIHRLKVIKNIDDVLPTSLEMYEKKYSKKYLKDSKLEEYNDLYLKKDPKDSEFIFKSGRNLKILDELQKQNDLENLKRLQLLEEERMIIVRDKLKEIQHWSLFSKQNKLFIDGKCKIGNIIGINPGMIYHHNLKKYIPISKIILKMNYGEILNVNLKEEIFFNSFNNYSDNIPKLQKNENSKLSFFEKLKKINEDENDELCEFENLMGMKFMNPISILNDFRSSKLPNVLDFSLLIPNDFPQDLLPFIPNKYFSHPDGIIQCSLMINIRNLKNEEILK
eukprot:gene6483-10488_t